MPGGGYTPYIAAAGGQNRKSVIDSITGAVADLGKNATPEEIRVAIQAAVIAYFSIGAAASIADVGGDFFDFAIGRSVSQVLGPLIDATIIAPEKELIKKAFRYGSPSARILVAIIESGTADPELLREALINQGVQDRFIQPVLDFAIAKRDQVSQKLLEQARIEQEKLIVLPIELQVSRLDQELKKVDSMLDALEEEQATFVLARDIKKVSRLADRMEKTIETLETASSEKVAATAMNTLKVLKVIARGVPS